MLASRRGERSQICRRLRIAVKVRAVRCILYSRYSTDKQTESSIEDQLRVCRDFVAARGWTVAGEFADRGISGAALGNRPGANEALAACGASDALIVNDLSRLSRSQDLPPLISRLRHRGVRVLGVQDGFDSDQRTARMQAGLSGIMSEEFRASIAARTHSAQEQLAREGKPVGGKAFDDHDLVREIFRRFAGGDSMRAIANDLNRRGVPSPGANWKQRSSRPRGKWQISALHALLRNERYIGRVIWNRSQWVKDPDTGQRHRRERPESEWVETAVEPLVDADTWARVQARFRVRQGRGGVPSYMLSGLLVCGICDGKLTVVGGKGRAYACGTFSAGGEHACTNSMRVRRAVVEKALLAPIVEELLSPAAEAEGVRQMRLARTEAEREPVDEDRGVAELERLVREGILSRELAAPSLKAAREKAAARRMAPVQGLPWPTPALWRQAVTNLSETITGDDVPAARAALREIIGEVRCVPEGEYLVAEVQAVRIQLGTGTGGCISNGSGGPLRIRIHHTRKKK